MFRPEAVVLSHLVLADKAVRGNIVKFYSNYAALYQREAKSPTVRPLPIHVAPFLIYDEVPTELEVEAAVCRLERYKNR